MRSSKINTFMTTNSERTLNSLYMDFKNNNFLTRNYERELSITYRLIIKTGLFNTSPIDLGLI